jgi:hypothetical protein
MFMNARVKIALGIVCAAATVVIASWPGPIDSSAKPDPCYTQDEVRLLMKSMNWTHDETVAVLEMACKFSRSREQQIAVGD